MLRRSFLKGAAATAAVATLPVAAIASAPTITPQGYIDAIRAAGGKISTTPNGGVFFQEPCNELHDTFWDVVIDVRSRLKEVPDGIEEVQRLLEAEQDKWEGDGWYHANRNAGGHDNPWHMRRVELDQGERFEVRPWPLWFRRPEQEQLLTRAQMNEFVRKRSDRQNG